MKVTYRVRYTLYTLCVYKRYGSEHDLNVSQPASYARLLFHVYVNTVWDAGSYRLCTDVFLPRSFSINPKASPYIISYFPLQANCSTNSSSSGTSPSTRSRKPGAIIESFVNHAPGVFSGTFSGERTSELTLEDLLPL